MVHKISVPSLDKIDDAAHEFLALMGDSTIYAFYGSMGAGKTTFINALSKALGVEDFIVWRASRRLLTSVSRTTSIRVRYA